MPSKKRPSISVGELIPFYSKRLAARRESQELPEKQRIVGVRKTYVERKINLINESKYLLSKQRKMHAERLSQFEDMLERIKKKRALEEDYLWFAFGPEEYKRQLAKVKPTERAACGDGACIVDTPPADRVPHLRKLTDLLHSKPPGWKEELNQRILARITFHRKAKEEADVLLATKKKLMDAALKERESLR